MLTFQSICKFLKIWNLFSTELPLCRWRRQHRQWEHVGSSRPTTETQFSKSSLAFFRTRLPIDNLPADTISNAIHPHHQPLQGLASPESYRWKFVCLSRSPPRPASAWGTYRLTVEMKVDEPSHRLWSEWQCDSICMGDNMHGWQHVTTVYAWVGSGESLLLPLGVARLLELWSTLGLPALL